MSRHIKDRLFKSLFGLEAGRRFVPKRCDTPKVRRLWAPWFEFAKVPQLFQKIDVEAHDVSARSAPTATDRNDKYHFGVATTL
jgi:hypothetical protein